MWGNRMAASGTRVGFGSVDYKEVTQLRKRMGQLQLTIGPAAMAVRPEFGAYMAYSKFLEEGTVKMAARPHIVPTVLFNMRVIANALLIETNTAINKIWNSSTGMSSAQMATTYGMVWMRVLNGPVRMAAVGLARSLKVYEYGFHMRSIRGYMVRRSDGDIESEQAKAAQERAARSA